MRKFNLVLALLLAASVCAFGQIIDPNVGIFDPAAACAPTCGDHPNSITLTEFGVWNYGNAGEPLPWYIIFAVPEDDGGAPTLSSNAGSPDSFTATGPTDAGSWDSSSSQTLYEFVAPFTTMTADEINAANNSMNTTNMFGPEEEAAFGSMPSAFEVYLYSMSPGLPVQTAELFDTSIVAGTFVAVLGVEHGTNPAGHPQTQVFATPFTTSGLGVTTSTTTTTTTTTTLSGPFTAGAIPEPNTIFLLGTALLGITTALRKRLRRS
jgi:hypothetical protein